MPASVNAEKSALGLRIGFAGSPAPEAKDGVHLRLNVPWLAGLPYEEIFPRARPFAGGDPSVTLYQSGGFLLGHLAFPFLGMDRSAQAQLAYEKILKICQRRHLYRIWNYVPQINSVSDELENYRAFCKGRSLAFESKFGNAYQRHLPAASAVGCEESALQIVFAAGETSPRHIENPEQVPAYRYPIEYGPRSPSFARATVVSDVGRPLVFISGTAAIKGHATVAPGTLSEQIECTLDNLRLVSRASGLGTSMGVEGTWRRHFKVYLRHVQDVAEAAAALDSRLFRPADKVSYLKADICRAALNIEIEVTLTGA